MRRSKEYLRDNFIRFILDGKRELTHEEIETRKGLLDLDYMVPPFQVVMISPNYSTIKNEEKDTFSSVFEEYIDELIGDYALKGYCLTNSYNNVVLLLTHGENPLVAREIDIRFIEIQKKLVKRFGIEVFIGIGSISENYQQISVSASDAQEMLAYKYQYADSGVINIRNLVQFQHNASIGNRIRFDRVLGCFQDGNLGRMEVRLNELVESIRQRPNVSKTSIRRTLVEVVVQILHLASNADVDVEEVLNDVDPYRWIMKQNHTEVITEWIMKISSELLCLMQSRKQSEEKMVIQQAKQFIEDNLSEPDLSLSQVSDAVGLSSTYCSLLFKQEVGMGINAYIAQNRIGRAQVMLRETQLPGTEIARQIGFSSAGYFGQVFKKNTGMTPNEYRRINMKI